MKDIHIVTSLGQIVISFCKKQDGEKKRTFEKAETERLFNCLGIDFQKLSYGAKGNPILDLQNQHVSISHSDGWFAVYLAKNTIGIDIQTTHKRIVDGTSYFINANEQIFSTELELHLIWATKEAIYKKYRGEITDLAKEVTIINMDHSNSKIKASFNGNLENLLFRHIENTYLVYTE